jgi:hypothetical protein
MAEESEQAKLEQKSWADLLASTPPGGVYEVPDLSYLNNERVWCLSLPALQMYCDSDSCGGYRFFDGQSDAYYLQQGIREFYITYKCRNCQRSSKKFAIIAASSSLDAPSTVIKVGELPAFGPHTPARVISLIGPDKEYFLKGRRAENQGLRIGAFAYYRRVVENQKGRLIEEIAKVSKRLGADAETLKRFEKAKNETQFSKAIDDIKGAIPESLLVRGHNPLTLLHSALSEGLHAQSDEECLEISTSIRVVLTELAEHVSQALKDEAELRHAVNRLLKPACAAGARP